MLLNRQSLPDKPNTRRQLTLFVPAAHAGPIEHIRKTYNTRQYQLIQSHVTLCREDEIENLPFILRNLEQQDLSELVIRFGSPIRFAHGLGVMMPGQGNNDPFHQLRMKILSGLADAVKVHQPHITLMHPRNSTCTGEIFKAILRIHLPAKLKFDTICLIEQTDNGPWYILEKYPLNGGSHPNENSHGFSGKMQ